MDNFTPIRNGLLDHIRDGKLCPFDLGIYVFLHLRADWATGIYHGCALTIAHAFNDPSLKHHVNKALIRLRERQYVNYRKGDGRRGGYPILIHKYQVTVGELSDTRLNAWKCGSSARPEYDIWDGRGTVEQQSRKSGGRVEEPIQDFNQDIHLDVDVKTRKRPFVRPSLEEVKTYCQERGNTVDAQKFLDHYQSNGWKVGRNPMKDWKAAVRTWEKNGVNANGARNAKQNPGDLARDVYERELALLNRRPH
jgi:hypothetical protein